MESRALLAICLQNVSGLKQKQNGVRLTDAVWIWTEPHSMRLKVRLTVQKQIQTGTILQQSFVVEFVVRNQQCVECQAEYRQGSWKSLIQLRQRVQHKRTFLYLEQLILKHNAHRGCLKIEIFKDGMDFYFADRNGGARFVSFLESVCPCRSKTSKKLISTDDKSNTQNIKYTHLVEICPICKDDLLYLPKSLANKMGQMERLVLVARVSDQVHVVDPRTGITGSFSATEYWRDPFRAIVSAARSRLTDFMVLARSAIELDRNPAQRRNRRPQRLAHVTFCRTNHVGTDRDVDETSHIGYLLKEGDVCVGYDLRDTQFSENDIGSDVVLPDALLVRKLYSGKQRMWKLQRLEQDAVAHNDNMEEDDDDEDFMQELEADKEMRNTMNLFKAKRMVDNSDSVTTDEANNDDQHVKIEELLDELDLETGPDEADTASEVAPVPMIDRDDARHIKEKEAASMVPSFSSEFRRT